MEEIRILLFSQTFIKEKDVTMLPVVRPEQVAQMFYSTLPKTSHISSSLFIAM